MRSRLNHPGSITILIAAIAAFVLCTSIDRTNPLLSDYQGDYHLTVSWSDPDTARLEVLSPFRIAFTQGTDAFARLEMNASVDTSALATSYATGDSLTITFTEAFNGTLRITGIRPNGKTVECDSIVTAARNPYVITGGGVYATGETARLVVAHDNHAAVRADWRVVWNGIDTLAITAIKQISATTQEVSATIIDERGNALVLMPVTLTAAGTRPRITALSLPSSLVQGDSLDLGVTATGTTSGHFRAIATLGGALVVDSTVSYGFGAQVVPGSRAMTDTGDVSMRVLVVDAVTGLRSHDSTRMVRIGYTVPSAAIADTARQVAIGRPFTVSASSAGVTQWRWRIACLSIDTTTFTSSLTLIIDTAKTCTLYVTPSNAWGLTGRIDTLIVHAREFKYTVQSITTPTELAARHGAGIRVCVVEGTTPVTGGVVWHWSVTPAPNDSAMRDDSAWVRYTDSTGTGLVDVRVFAIVNGTDSTDLFSLPLVVRRYAPSIAFVSSTYQGGVNDSVQVSVTTADFNGTVDSVYTRWQRSGGTWSADRNLGRVSQFKVAFVDTGHYRLESWCRDNDGFVSPPTSTTVIVSAGKPYFTGSTSLDTTMFVNDTTTFDVSASAGVTGEIIERYVWMLGSTVLQSSASSSWLGTFSMANSVQDVRVWAVNGRSDTSIAPFALTVTVAAGAPTIDTTSLSATTAFINGSITLTTGAHDINGVVTGIEVDTTGDDTADAITSVIPDSQITATTPLAFPRAGVYAIRARAIDEDGMRGIWRGAGNVVVSNGEPTVTGISPDSAWWNHPVTLTASAVDNGIVDSCAFSGNGNVWSTWHAGLSFDTSFADTGTIRVYARVKDNDDVVSASYTDSVWVRSGRPVVSAVTIDTTDGLVFVADTRVYRVTATDPNGTIRMLYASWNGDTTAEESIAVNAASVIGTFTHAYTIAQAGSIAPRFWARDSDGLIGAGATKVLSVRVGRPRMTSIGTDRDTVWINDQVRYTMTAVDTNGAIAERYISFNNGATYRRLSGVHLDTALSGSGTTTMKAFVVDNDSIVSDTLSVALTVHLGAPSISSIASDSTVFINDARQFSIAGSDTNGTIDSVKIDNGSGSFGVFVKTTGGAYTLNRTFTRPEAGARTIRVIAKDNDGVLSDTARLAMTVRLGTPTIDSVKVDTTGNNLFVRDLRTYRVFASDTNGGIKMIYAAWNGEASPTDSIAVSFASGGSDTITHRYDTTMAGNRTARFWVKDDDTLRSSVKDNTIFVRLGAPMVWGGSGDTLFLVVNKDYGTYYYRPNHYDTNGTIVRYYYGATADTNAAVKTSADSMQYIVDDLNVNRGAGRYIYGRDDDGLLRGQRFVVYADSAPLRPVLVAPAADTAFGPALQVTLKWTGLDKHDSLGTEYAVLVNPPLPSTPEDTVQQFKRASLYTIQGTSTITYSYTPTVNGIYAWRIVARDARGTRTVGPVWQFSHPGQ